MNTLPSYEQVIALHKKYAPSVAAFDLVFTHCQIVWELAEQLMEKSNFSINPELVKVGCLLHDIGVYRLYLPNGEIDHANYIKHGSLGYDLLKDEEFEERLCRFAAHHTGVGLTKKEIIKDGLPIPPADYFAQNLEEEIVMYADKFHTKTTPPAFMTSQTYETKLAQFGLAKVEKFKAYQQKFGVPDLQPIAEKYGLKVI